MTLLLVWYALGWAVIGFAVEESRQSYIGRYYTATLTVGQFVFLMLAAPFYAIGLLLAWVIVGIDDTLSKLFNIVIWEDD